MKVYIIGWKFMTSTAADDESMLHLAYAGERRTLCGVKIPKWRTVYGRVVEGRAQCRRCFGAKDTSG